MIVTLAALVAFSPPARQIALSLFLKIDRLEQYKKLGILQDIPLVFGFFHPFADCGGGGERVLWTAIAAIQAKWPTAISLVYIWDQAKSSSKEDILAKVKVRRNGQMEGARQEEGLI